MQHMERFLCNFDNQMHNAHFSGIFFVDTKTVNKIEFELSRKTTFRLQFIKRFMNLNEKLFIDAFNDVRLGLQAMYDVHVQNP